MDNQKNNPPEMKDCSGCGQDKPIDQFGVNRTNFDGRANNCLECARAHDRERREPQEASLTEADLSRLKAAITEQHESDITPHPAEVVEKVWSLFPKDKFAALWANQLKNCIKSKSLVSVQKSIDAMMKATADHREGSIGDLAGLTDEDLARELNKVLNRPQLAEHTLPEEADGPATKIA